MMGKVLADQRGQNMEVYLEEIMVKSKSEQSLVQDVKETLRKVKSVNIKIDPNTSSFEVEEGRFLGQVVTKEGIRADPKKVQAIIQSPTIKGPNQIQSLFLQLTTIGKFIPKLSELKYPINKEGEELMICLRQRNETISFVLMVEREGVQAPVSYGKEAIEEGSGVGIILVSLDEKMHSYAIRLKFNASDHAMDCEALLAGLVASVSKGMKYLYVFINSLTLVAQIEGNHTPLTVHERKYKEEIMDAIVPFHMFQITHLPKILNSKTEVLTGLATIKL
ncbi:reverse transcriptase domain-containing protein [Tanacetum coccineum]|uniref:Reverse transcriptase domain-containing protein n=1 Tax=Tanacetum coccineum TaxID=301880 RepID=A0ABQ5BUX8_9ASTR